jgi:hypothetical protein
MKLLVAEITIGFPLGGSPRLIRTHQGLLSFIKLNTSALVTIESSVKVLVPQYAKRRDCPTVNVVQLAGTSF